MREFRLRQGYGGQGRGRSDQARPTRRARHFEGDVRPPRSAASKTTPISPKFSRRSKASRPGNIWKRSGRSRTHRPAGALCAKHRVRAEHFAQSAWCGRSGNGLLRTFTDFYGHGTRLREAAVLCHVRIRPYPSVFVRFYTALSIGSAPCGVPTRRRLPRRANERDA